MNVLLQTLDKFSFPEIQSKAADKGDDKDDVPPETKEIPPVCFFML